MKLGVQLFTVRKHAQKDLAGCLEKLNDLGLKYIEAARIEFNNSTGEIFAKYKEKYGMEVVASQITFNTLKNDMKNVLDFHKQTNCKNTIISVLPTENILGNHKQLKEFCQKANTLASSYKNEGIQLCYHHHDFEFTKTEEGIKFPVLKEHFSEDVKFIIDTYWATKSGFAAETLIRSLNGRVQGVHLRDFALYLGLARRPKDYALGDGVIDFKSVLQACKDTNVEYGAIEQKTKKPYQELAKSVAYLKSLGEDNLL